MARSDRGSGERRGARGNQNAVSPAPAGPYSRAGACLHRVPRHAEAVASADCSDWPLDRGSPRRVDPGGTTSGASDFFRRHRDAACDGRRSLRTEPPPPLPHRRSLRAAMESRATGAARGPRRPDRSVAEGPRAGARFGVHVRAHGACTAHPPHISTRSLAHARGSHRVTRDRCCDVRNAA